MLAGVTFVDGGGAVLRREQLVGVVVEVSDGVVALRRDGTDGSHGTDADELVLVPADEESFKPARPGRYALSGTGQVVVDPDFLCAWTVVVDST